MVLGEATPQSEREVLAPGQRVGDHLVVRSILGQGGTAIVYEALHTRLGAPVALKVLQVEEPFVRDAALRLQREAEVCANLDDPHVPRVYDVGALPDGTPYLVMEKVSGDTLEHMLSGGPLSLRMAAVIAEDLLRGLEAVHRAGIVHRDIKPANLIIKLNPEGGAQVRLMDFGVSKSIGPESGDDPKLTRMGTVVGTPHYMAPEQITADAVDARADLYAAGVVLYEMLSGRTPYEGDTTAEVVAAVLRGHPPPLRRIAPRVPPPVAAVVMRAMAAAPRDRFPTARDMRFALAEALRGRPPMLRLRPEPERMRPVRRSHAPLWIGACVGVATLVGAAFWPGSVDRNLGADGSPASVARAKERARQEASAQAAQARVATPAEAAQHPGANDVVLAPAPAEAAGAESADVAAPAPGEAAADQVLDEGQGVSPRYRVGLAGEQKLALDMPDAQVAVEPAQTGEAGSDAAPRTRSRARAEAERAEAEARAARESARAMPPARDPQPVGPGIVLSDYLRHLDAIREELVELPESRGLPPLSADEPVPPNPYAEEESH